MLRQWLEDRRAARESAKRNYLSCWQEICGIIAKRCEQQAHLLDVHSKSNKKRIAKASKYLWRLKQGNRPYTIICFPDTERPPFWGTIQTWGPIIAIRSIDGPRASTPIGGPCGSCNPLGVYRTGGVWDDHSSGTNNEICEFGYRPDACAWSRGAYVEAKYCLAIFEERFAIRQL